MRCIEISARKSSNTLKYVVQKIQKYLSRYRHFAGTGTHSTVQVQQRKDASDQRVQPGTCGGNRASARVQVRGAVSDAQLHEAPPSRPRRCVPGARAWDTCSSLIFTLLLLLQGSMRFRRGSVACAPSGTHGIHFCANSSRKPARYRMVPCSSLWPRAWTRLFA